MPKEYPRKLRLNTQLQRELTELIRDELGDPRVTGVNVVAVDVTPDMRHAKVFISLLALDADPAPAVAALNHAGGKLRHELKQRLRLRHIPELHFRAERATAAALHLDKLIREARDQDRGNAAQRGEPGAKED
jgi:ribosome-binding factor A